VEIESYVGKEVPNWYGTRSIHISLERANNEVDTLSRQFCKDNNGHDSGACQCGTTGTLGAL
jgi:hypothetical protein